MLGREEIRTVSGRIIIPGETHQRIVVSSHTRIAATIGKLRLQAVVAQANALLSIWTSDAWCDFWNGLELSVVSFPMLELSYDAPDANR
jgi:hypothetical protein